MSKFSHDAADDDATAMPPTTTLVLFRFFVGLTGFLFQFVFRTGCTNRLRDFLTIAFPTALKVGTWGFEGIIILLLCFLSLSEIIFYKEISKFQ